MSSDRRQVPGATAPRIVVKPRRRASDRRVVAPPPGSPTPIWISRRARTGLMAAAGVLLFLLVYFAPSILTLVLGGAAFALILSFPVRLLAHVMPRGVAILLSFLGVIGALVMCVVIVVPILAEQLSALITSAPGIAARLQERLPELLGRLEDRGLLPSTPERFSADMHRNVLAAFEGFARRMLGGLGQFIAGAVSTALTMFGVVFLAAYFLSDARKIEAVALHATPRRYRRDVHDLWNAFRFTLSRYLGGLALSLAIQGVLSAVVLYCLGVPYPVLLGAWVAITALIPFLGAWLGCVPAVLLALTISPTTALFTAVLFLAIQQLEGNVLTPRIQGQAVRVHPILVFLAVIAAGELFGIMGVVFAVPLVAVARVLFDFFRARLRTADRRDPVAA